MGGIFQTVVSVTAFSCAERFLGFLYRIFLSRSLGSEGLGLYQISLSVLGLFMTVTSSGIPITVSRIMIKYKSEGKENKISSVVTAGVLTAIALCVPLVLLVLSKSGLLNILFSDERCLTVLGVMIPGLIFTSVYAVIRGTFWGNKQFMPYSVIEFLEEAVMLIAGIILVNTAVDLQDGVVKAGYAVLISYLFSFTVSMAVFFIKGGRLKSPKGELRPLLRSATPITAMKTSTSLINTLIAVLLPARLVYYGISSSTAVSQFGKVFGMAFPLIFMPSTIIGSLALVLVPELSSNYYSKRFTTLKNNVEKAIKFACVIACLIIPVFLSMGREIGEFIYKDETAGSYVVKGALTMLPMSLAMISTSMLNSLNKEKQTLLSYFCGASVMLVCIYFLPSVIGIDALTVGMFCNFLITAIINVVLLYKTCPIKIKVLKPIILALLSVIPSALFGIFLKGILKNLLSVWLLAIICSALIFLFALAFLAAFGLLDFVFEKKSNIKVFKVRHSFNNGN